MNLSLSYQQIFFPDDLAWVLPHLKTGLFMTDFQVMPIKSFYIVTMTGIYR